MFIFSLQFNFIILINFWRFRKKSDNKHKQLPIKAICLFFVIRLSDLATMSQRLRVKKEKKCSISSKILRCIFRFWSFPPQLRQNVSIKSNNISIIRAHNASGISKRLIPVMFFISKSKLSSFSNCEWLIRMRLNLILLFGFLIDWNYKVGQIKEFFVPFSIDIKRIFHSSCPFDWQQSKRDLKEFLPTQPERNGISDAQRKHSMVENKVRPDPRKNRQPRFHLSAVGSNQQNIRVSKLLLNTNLLQLIFQ